MTSTVFHEILPVGNCAQKLNPQTGGADAQAEALLHEILSAKDSVVITGTTYYVSPSGDDANDGISPETAWQTTAAVLAHDEQFQPGDGVLFERGGIYRFNGCIDAKTGMTYAAYGQGDKPAFYGSVQNYAWGNLWEPSDNENIWKMPLPKPEAGLMVFNHGEAAGMPKYFGVDELKENGDFHHDLQNAVLYLYLDKGNPSAVYNDIEIGTRVTMFNVPKYVTDVTFDNLCAKYCGLFTFFVKQHTHNTRITNCEIGWVGGCRFSSGKVGLGNGISFWQGAEDALVENCWIYHCYDAGITPQGIDDAHTYRNLVLRKNLIEFCNYSIEVFDRTSASVVDGLIIEENILRFAGYGFIPMERRPDKSYAVAHYTGWSWNYDELTGDGIVIKNNIFDCSTDNLVFWFKKTYESGLEISGNSFYQKANPSGHVMMFAENGMLSATNQEEFEEAVRTFDRNPSDVKWVP